MVDHDCALFYRAKNAIVASGHFSQISIVTDTRENKISVFYGFGWRSRNLAAISLLPLPGLFGGAVEYRNVVAFFYEMACHRETHVAEADKCSFNFCAHRIVLFE